MACCDWKIAGRMWFNLGHGWIPNCTGNMEMRRRQSFSMLCYHLKPYADIALTCLIRYTALNNYITSYGARTHTLHYITVQCIALHCIALQYNTIPYNAIHTYIHTHMYTYVCIGYILRVSPPKSPWFCCFSQPWEPRPRIAMSTTTRSSWPNPWPRSRKEGMEGIDPGRRRSWGKRVQKDVENPSKKWFRRENDWQVVGSPHWTVCLRQCIF